MLDELEIQIRGGKIFKMMNIEENKAFMGKVINALWVIKQFG